MARLGDWTQKLAVGAGGGDGWGVHYRAVEARERGEDVIILTVGDHAFPTPEPIVQEAVDALRAGHHHYTAAAGERYLREAFARKSSGHLGRRIDWRECVVLPGAQCCLFATAMIAVDPGDEAIVVEPYYVPYPATLRAAGARMVTVRARPEDGWLPKAQEIAAAVTPRTRLILINTPNNPTGVVYPRALLEEIGEIARAHDLWIVSDEVYADLVFDGDHVSVAEIPGLEERAVVIESLSKSHAMTGWRVGWIVAPRVFADALELLASAMLFGMAPFIQDAARLAAERGDEDPAAIRAIYRHRRDIALAGLAKAPGLRFHEPAGGMYIMLDPRGLGLSGADFAEELMAREKVALTPGVSFGPAGFAFARMTLTEDDARIEEACARIARFAALRANAPAGA